MVILVPYNDAMRLGQGFNSFTQQICIDDAVIVDPKRAENILTNNGTTMRILAQKTNKASVWRQMKEFVIDGKETKISTEPKNLIEKPEEEDKENQQEQTQAPSSQSKEEKKPAALHSVTDYDNKQKEIADKIASNAAKGIEEEEDDEEEKPKPKENEKDGENEEEDEEPEDENLKLDAKLKESDAKKEENRKNQEKQGKEFKQSILLNQKDITTDSWKSSEQNLKEATDKIKTKFDEGRVSLGIGKESDNPELWPIQNSKGTSQTVTYISHFVDKVSEINNDMRLSAALSIKAGKFGGSGRGSFFNSEEFNESDLRFYISVKVINQSINFKDALQYNPVPNLNPQNKEEFAKVFGDSFISGFVEGGEFNALVLMKIKNEAKLQDIKAEVKVAFTTADKDGSKDEKKDGKAIEGEEKAGDKKKVEEPKKSNDKADDGKGSKDKKGVKINADGNLKLAKRNIAMNAETTIYVSWTGGAAIKPYDEKWTIDSLMAAAQRFPALVALYPQRTYAQVTEYRHLRSFIKLKPTSLLPITYQNAQMYTNTLLDVYMEYKTLYKKVATDILDVQSGEKVFKEELKIMVEDENKKDDSQTVSEEASDPSLVLRKVQLSKALIAARLTQVFPSTIEGLGQACQAIRKQMNEIVREVDAITAKPELSLLETDSKWAGPASFQTLIPKIEFKVRKVRGTPLSNKSLEDSRDEGSNMGAEAFVVHLFNEENSPLSLSETEQLELSEIEQNSPSLADKTRVTAPVGSTTAGTSFTGLEHNLPEPVISHVTVYQKDGVFCCMSVDYDIGLTVEYGGHIGDYTAKYPKAEFGKFDLKELGLSEMITSVSIEVEGGVSVDYIHDHDHIDGHEHSKTDADDDANADKNKLRVIGIALSTNRGQKLQALCQRTDQRKNEFTDKHKIHQFEKPLKDSYVSGFWGRQSNGGIHRLGLIWTQAPPRTSLFDEEIPMECISGSLNKSEIVNFERTLQDKPNLAYGLRAFGQGTGEKSVVESENNKPLKVETKLSEITRNGFKYSQNPSDVPKLVDWMVLPELTDTFIQTGDLEFGLADDDKISKEVHEKSQTVEFKLPFLTEGSVRAICWLMEFETDRPDEENPSTEDFHIKTGIVGEVSSKMMTIKVGDPRAFVVKTASKDATTTTNEVPRSTFWRAKVGWLAYQYTGGDRNEEEFAHGKMTSPFKADQTRIVWDTIWAGHPTFSTEPSQTFIALSEIKGKRAKQNYMIDEKNRYSVTLKENTKDKITLIAEAPPNSCLGAVWISCL